MQLEGLPPELIDPILLQMGPYELYILTRVSTVYNAIVRDSFIRQYRFYFTSLRGTVTKKRAALLKHIGEQTPDETFPLCFFLRALASFRSWAQDGMKPLDYWSGRNHVDYCFITFSPTIPIIPLRQFQIYRTTKSTLGVMVKRMVRRLVIDEGRCIIESQIYTKPFEYANTSDIEALGLVPIQDYFTHYEVISRNIEGNLVLGLAQYQVSSFDPAIVSRVNPSFDHYQLRIGNPKSKGLFTTESWKKMSSVV